MPPSCAPHQGALCADSGHINVHETGAIESTGHKGTPPPAENGKLSADTIEKAIAAHRKDESFEHIVQPGLVYISHPTEYGTLLYPCGTGSHLRGVPQRGGYLFVDGARLGYGLAADGTDVTLPVLAELGRCVLYRRHQSGGSFWRGGRHHQPGMEAGLPLPHQAAGGMLAKGRLLGIQFEELMTDGLYTQLAATPTSWPTGCGTFSVPPVIPCSLTPLPTSSSPILPDADYAVLRSTSEGEFWTRVDEKPLCHSFLHQLVHHQRSC